LKVKRVLAHIRDIVPDAIAACKSRFSLRKATHPRDRFTSNTAGPDHRCQHANPAVAGEPTSVETLSTTKSSKLNQIGQIVRYAQYAARPTHNVNDVPT
jgi:hypothetical protein